MARRALVLGSQIEGLRGVGNDTQRMAAMLEARGFTIDLRVGEAATRAGMLAGYDQLIDATTPEDAAVVYYCGHGYYASVSEEGRVWQCITPTDLRAGNDTDWRGITAWELSIKQAQLTAKTRNVTVILDCCHSGQLSRGDGVDHARTRALPHPVRAGFADHLEALRTLYGKDFEAVDSVGNPHAVRVVACGQSEPAFEYTNKSDNPDDADEYHGVFTDALIDVLMEIDTAPVSWAAIINAIRTRVQRRFPRQRPDIEGPVRRVPFTLDEQVDQRSVAVAALGKRFRLSAGQLTGAIVGDLYSVLPADTPILDGARSVAQLEIVEVSPTTATARRVEGGDPIPRDAVAVPLRRQSQRWAVAVDAPRSARASVEAAIIASATLRLSPPCERSPLATVRVKDDTVTIEDADGPLWPPAPFPSNLDLVLGHVANLGVAQGIRELEGEHGVSASSLAVQLGLVRDGQRVPLSDYGRVLTPRDRYYLQIENRRERPLFVHLLNINARGKVTMLTHFARGGKVLDRNHPSITFGQRVDGAFVGVGLRWPEGLLADGLPRPMELVVIATPITTDLSGLETRDVVVMRSGGNPLQQLLAQLCDGRYRDAHGGALDGKPNDSTVDGFLVKRLSILLSPGELTSEGVAHATD